MGTPVAVPASAAAQPVVLAQVIGGPDPSTVIKNGTASPMAMATAFPTQRSTSEDDAEYARQLQQIEERDAAASDVVYTVQERRRIEAVGREAYFGPMSMMCFIFPGTVFPCVMWPLICICPLDQREVVITAPAGTQITAHRMYRN